MNMLPRTSANMPPTQIPMIAGVERPLWYMPAHLSFAIWSVPADFMQSLQAGFSSLSAANCWDIAFRNPSGSFWESIFVGAKDLQAIFFFILNVTREKPVPAATRVVLQ